MQFSRSRSSFWQSEHSPIQKGTHRKNAKEKKYLLNLASIPNYLNPEKKKETKWKIRMGSRVMFHIPRSSNDALSMAT